MEPKAVSLTGARKAAVLLMAVGEDLAKEILRTLPESDVERLTEEFADLRGITPEVSAAVSAKSESSGGQVADLLSPRRTTSPARPSTRCRPRTWPSLNGHERLAE